MVYIKDEALDFLPDTTGLMGTPSTLDFMAGQQPSIASPTSPIVGSQPLSKPYVQPDHVKYAPRGGYGPTIPAVYGLPAKTLEPPLSWQSQKLLDQYHAGETPGYAAGPTGMREAVERALRGLPQPQRPRRQVDWDPALMDSIQSKEPYAGLDGNGRMELVEPQMTPEEKAQRRAGARADRASKRARAQQMIADRKKQQANDSKRRRMPANPIIGAHEASGDGPPAPRRGGKQEETLGRMDFIKIGMDLEKLPYPGDGPIGDDKRQAWIEGQKYGVVGQQNEQQQAAWLDHLEEVGRRAYGAPARRAAAAAASAGTGSLAAPPMPTGFREWAPARRREFVEQWIAQMRAAGHDPNEIKAAAHAAGYTPEAFKP